MPSDRTVITFLNAAEATCTASAVIGSFRNSSISCFGIDGTAVGASVAGFGLRGVLAPLSYMLCLTQNF